MSRSPHVRRKRKQFWLLVRRPNRWLFHSAHASLADAEATANKLPEAWTWWGHMNDANKLMKEPLESLP